VGIAPGDRSGIRTLGIDSWLNRNSGDDEISIAFKSTENRLAS